MLTAELNSQGYTQACNAASHSMHKTCLRSGAFSSSWPELLCGTLSLATCSAQYWAWTSLSTIQVTESYCLSAHQKLAARPFSNSCKHLNVTFQCIMYFFSRQHQGSTDTGASAGGCSSNVINENCIGGSSRPRASSRCSTCLEQTCRSLCALALSREYFASDSHRQHDAASSCSRVWH